MFIYSSTMLYNIQNLPWSFVAPHTDLTFPIERPGMGLFLCKLKCFIFFLFYSPNRIPFKFNFCTMKERNTYFVEWMVRSLAKIWNLEQGVTIPLRLQQKNLNSVCNTTIHIPTIYDQEAISSELCMKMPTVLSPSWGNVQGYNTTSLRIWSLCSYTRLILEDLLLATQTFSQNNSKCRYLPNRLADCQAFCAQWH